MTIGPTLNRPSGPFDLNVRGELRLNICDWNAWQSERPDVASSGAMTTVAKRAEGDSGTRFRPGPYAQTDLSYKVGNHLAIRCFFRLDTAREFRAQADPSAFQIDPWGFSIGFQLRDQLT